MGIRFLCPNGHRLNVKTFLAGKRGICPHCGIGVDIPLESQIPSRREARQNALVGAVKGSGEDESLQAVTADRIDSAPSSESASSKPPSPVSAETSNSNPIAEGPHLVWYVRPPSGGQYGPAVGEIMQRWLQEGRVSSDSLVWREGWEDWRSADEVFPDLAVPSESEDHSAAGPSPRPAAPSHNSSQARQTRQPSRLDDFDPFDDGQSQNPPPSEGGFGPAPWAASGQAAPALEFDATSAGELTSPAAAYSKSKRAAGNLGVAVVVLLGIICIALLVAAVFVVLRT